MTEPTRCALCGHTDRRDLRTALAHWLDAPQDMAYEHVIRCRDDAACRARIESQGDVWPLVVTAQKGVA